MLHRHYLRKPTRIFWFIPWNKKVAEIKSESSSAIKEKNPAFDLRYEGLLIRVLDESERPNIERLAEMHKQVFGEEAEVVPREKEE